MPFTRYSPLLPQFYLFKSSRQLTVLPPFQAALEKLQLKANWDETLEKHLDWMLMIYIQSILTMMMVEWKSSSSSSPSPSLVLCLLLSFVFIRIVIICSSLAYGVWRKFLSLVSQLDGSIPSTDEHDCRVVRSVEP